MDRKIALVTGATSGIGKATAMALAQTEFDVIITGRRENILTELVSEIESKTKSKAYKLVFDVRHYSDVQRAIDSLPEEWTKIDLLINNSGLALGLEPLCEGSVDDWDVMIDTNVKGLLFVTKLVTKGMIERRSGHVINIASIAGREAYANGNVYCATKSAVISLTQSMRLELVKYGIRVGCISPGMVETNFSNIRFHGNDQKAKDVYRDVDPLTAEDIAEAILFMATRPSHVCIDDMLIMATAQGFTRDVVRNSSKQ